MLHSDKAQQDRHVAQLMLSYCVEQLLARQHLLVELCRREVVVHHGGLEACVGHRAQEAAALVRERRHILLDVRGLLME